MFKWEYFDKNKNPRLLHQTWNFARYLFTQYSNKNKINMQKCKKKVFHMYVKSIYHVSNKQK